MKTIHFLIENSFAGVETGASERAELPQGTWTIGKASIGNSEKNPLGRQHREEGVAQVSRESLSPCWQHMIRSPQKMSLQYAGGHAGLM